MGSLWILTQSIPNEIRNGMHLESSQKLHRIVSQVLDKFNRYDSNWWIEDWKRCVDIISNQEIDCRNYRKERTICPQIEYGSN